MPLSPQKWFDNYPFARTKVCLAVGQALSSCPAATGHLVRRKDEVRVMSFFLAHLQQKVGVFAGDETIFGTSPAREAVFAPRGTVLRPAGSHPGRPWFCGGK